MLTLICGLPRAGKTTYSQQFKDVIHLDTSGAYKGVLHKVKYLSGDIIVEGVYRLKYERNKLINTYNTDKYKCIWLNTPDKIRRSRDGWDKWCDKPFEPPTLEEGWDEIIIISGENDIKHIVKE
jgi:hypothetical protein